VLNGEHGSLVRPLFALRTELRSTRQRYSTHGAETSFSNEPPRWLRWLHAASLQEGGTGLNEDTITTCPNECKERLCSSELRYGRLRPKNYGLHGAM